jgi:peptide deformylase
MPVRPIIHYGQPCLHSPAAPVTRFDDQLAALLLDMRHTLYAAPGIGLAAPQIGVALRVIVIDLSVGTDPVQLIQLVNPVLVEAEGRERHAEGCLSIPGFEGAPSRPARVVVAGLDETGAPHTYAAAGLLARAFCHEIDHVNGLLFVERLAPFKRELAKRRLRKRFPGAA